MIVFLKPRGTLSNSQVSIERGFSNLIDEFAQSSIITHDVKLQSFDRVARGDVSPFISVRIHLSAVGRINPNAANAKAPRRF